LGVFLDCMLPLRRRDQLNCVRTGPLAQGGRDRSRVLERAAVRFNQIAGIMRQWRSLTAICSLREKRATAIRTIAMLKPSRCTTGEGHVRAHARVRHSGYVSLYCTLLSTSFRPCLGGLTGLIMASAATQLTPCLKWLPACSRTEIPSYAALTVPRLRTYVHGQVTPRECNHPRSLVALGGCLFCMQGLEKTGTSRGRVCLVSSKNEPTPVRSPPRNSRLWTAQC
jgi:hypothetical protein